MQALKQYKDNYTTKRILAIIMNICRAIRHLKAKNIIWCNFSHNNIIYDGENAVICGFGTSRIKVSRTLNISKKILGLKGDARYASPEMIQNKYYGLRHDVWGLGVLAFFLFTGHFPFNGENDFKICENILYSEPDWSLLGKRKIDLVIIQLIQEMLIKDPNERITIRNVMKYKIFYILKQSIDKVILELKF